MTLLIQNNPKIMKNLIKTIFLLLFCQFSFAQKLVYKNSGNITDEKGKNLSSTEVRSLLSNNLTLLQEYDIGKSKKIVGNVLLVGGLSLTFGLSAVQVYHGRPVPIGLVTAGLVSTLVAIPVKIGYRKKIKHVVSEFNNQNNVSDTNFNIQSMNLLANSNGFGVKFILN